ALRHVLVVHDEVIEHPHHRPFGEDRRLLVDRHARRAVGTVHFQNAALLLGECRLSGEHCKEQRARRRESSQIPLHLRVPPLFLQVRPVPSWLGSLTKPAAEPCYHPGSLLSSRSKCRRFGVYHKSIKRGRMVADALPANYIRALDSADHATSIKNAVDSSVLIPQ